MSPVTSYVLMLIMLIPAVAHAGISIYPREVIVQDEAESITVHNLGTEPEYVSIKLSRLLNPGVSLEDEQLQAIGETEHPSLYATPFRMTLAPGQRKHITLKPLRTVSTEQIYRLDVRPEVTAMTSGRAGRVGTVVIKIAHGGLVRHLPQKTSAAIQVFCLANGARISATGNVRHRVEGAEVDGTVQEPFNVYPDTPRLLTGKRVAIPGYPVCTSTVP